MKLNEMITTATEHDVASASAEQILCAANTHTPGKAYRPRMRAAAVIAAALCLLTVTLYASGVLSGFGTAFTVPLESGEVRVLAQTTDNTDVVWSITEVWYDSYNLHIGGTVTLPLIPQEDVVYKASGRFRTGSPEEIYYLDGTLYPNGTETVPFVMSAPTVTDGEGGARRPGWEEEEVRDERRMSKSTRGARLGRGASRIPAGSPQRPSPEAPRLARRCPKAPVPASPTLARVLGAHFRVQWEDGPSQLLTEQARACARGRSPELECSAGV